MDYTITMRQDSASEHQLQLPSVLKITDGPIAKIDNNLADIQSAIVQVFNYNPGYLTQDDVYWLLNIFVPAAHLLSEVVVRYLVASVVQPLVDDGLVQGNMTNAQILDVLQSSIEDGTYHADTKSANRHRAKAISFLGRVTDLLSSIRYMYSTYRKFLFAIRHYEPLDDKQVSDFSPCVVDPQEEELVKLLVERSQQVENIRTGYSDLCKRFKSLEGGSYERVHDLLDECITTHNLTITQVLTFVTA